MAISVDISDRLYDYSDEEKAAEAVAQFQSEFGLSDEEVIALWSIEMGEPRKVLEGRIFEAVDAVGSPKRARESVPTGVRLFVHSELG